MTLTFLADPKQPSLYYSPMLSGLFMSHCSAFDDPDEEAEQNTVWVLFTSGSGFCCAAVLYDFCVLGPSPHCKLGPQGSI